MNCPKCDIQTQNTKICDGCGIIIEKYFLAKEQQFVRIDNPDSEIFLEAPDQNLKLLVFTLPLAVIFAASIYSMTIISYFAHFMTCWVHEFGHTLISWWSSLFAIPTVLFTFYPSDEKSIILFLVEAAISVIAARFFAKKKMYFMSFVSSLYLILTIYFTLFASMQKINEIRVYSGIGAEFWLNTLLIISFYYRLPKKEGWKPLRFVVLTYGMVGFFKIYMLFSSIKKGMANLPMGSAAVGPDDSNGDINRLITEFGWTETSITNSYLHLGTICIWIIVAHYLIFIYQHLKTNNH